MKYRMLIIFVAFCSLIVSCTSMQMSNEDEITKQVGKQENQVTQYVEQKRYADAEPFARQAIDIAEKGLGSGHPLVALELNLLAWIYLKQAKYTEAEPLFKRSLNLSEQQVKGRWGSWWANHPMKRMIIYEGLAEVYSAQGRYQEAEQVLRNTLVIFEKAGIPAEFLTGVRNSLSEIYKKTGGEVEAQKLNDISRRRVKATEKSVAHPAVPGKDDRIMVRAMSVNLPPGNNWQKREVPIPEDGLLLEFERSLPNGNRVQIHIAEYFGTRGSVAYLSVMCGQSDAKRLAEFVGMLTNIPQLKEGLRNSEWVDTVRTPQKRFGAVCKEYHVVREERVEEKELFLCQDWMLFCIDPVSHIPIEIDYAELYPAVGGEPSQSFAADAAAFFNRIEFRSQ